MYCMSFKRQTGRSILNSIQIDWKICEKMSAEVFDSKRTYFEWRSRSSKHASKVIFSGLCHTKFERNLPVNVMQLNFSVLFLYFVSYCSTFWGREEGGGGGAQNHTRRVLSFEHWLGMTERVSGSSHQQVQKHTKFHPNRSRSLSDNWRRSFLVSLWPRLEAKGTLTSNKIESLTVCVMPAISEQIGPQTSECKPNFFFKQWAENNSYFPCFNESHSNQNQDVQLKLLHHNIKGYRHKLKRLWENVSNRFSVALTLWSPVAVHVTELGIK